MSSVQLEAIVALTNTVTATGTAEQLVSTRNTWFRKFAIVAAKVTGANTGNVYIGPAGVDKTNFQYITLNPGDYWEFESPGGTVLDLSSFWIDAATNGDGITGFYVTE